MNKLAAIFLVTVLCGSTARAKQSQRASKDLSGAWIGDEDLTTVARDPALRSLNLAHTHLSDRALLYLRPAVRITALDLRFSEQIGDEGVAYIKDLTALRSINLHGTKVTDTTTSYLAGMQDLTAVDVGFARITDAGLSLLMRLAKLETLNLGGNRITSAGLQTLRTFRLLRTLDLGGKQRTDSGLWVVQIDDDAIEAVASVPNLQALRLLELPVNDAQIGRLARHASLAKLDLSACTNVTDSSLDALVRLKSLVWLNVSGTGISAEALRRFALARPEVRLIAFSPGSQDLHLAK